MKLGNTQQEGTGAFNMAIATLMRIDKVLQQIRDLVFAPYGLPTKQSIKIELTKSLFQLSSPLLKEDIVKNYNWILELKPIEASVGRHGRATGEKKAIFNYDLELKLNKAIVDIQRELQKEGDYLMAGKSDVRFNWKAE